MSKIESLGIMILIYLRIKMELVIISKRLNLWFYNLGTNFKLILVFILNRNIKFNNIVL